MGDAAALRPGGRVCVTGASGYIASVLVAALKQKGYVVVGTVRDISRFCAEAVFEDVELFKADMLDASSLAAAFARCDAVVHTASPFWFPTPQHDPMEDFVRPALEGTKNVLEAAYAAGVRNVVITSSTGAVTPQRPGDFPGDEPGWTRPFGESDWSLDSTAENSPYRYSKRVAELAAWEFHREHSDLHLATICPSGTLGPMVMGRTDGECVQLFKKIMTGGDGGAVSNQTIGWVDVRDVALAHIAALERRAANGKRFVVSLQARPPTEPGTIGLT
jgi:dihydroflavonol-4-reductase